LRHCAKSNSAIGWGTILQAILLLVEALRYKEKCSWISHCTRSSSAVGLGTALQEVVQSVEVLRYKQ